MKFEWRLIEAKIFALIEKAVLRVLNGQQEEWVTGKELSEKIPIFTQDFIKKYGSVLPREKMEYYGQDGEICETRYMYPLHALNVMVQKGVFRTADGTMHAFESYKTITV